VGILNSNKNKRGEKMTKTTVSNFTLKGRETLSSYAAFTLEGEMTARVEREGDKWTIVERNGVAKGTSDGENEAIYIENEDAIKSIEKHIVPLLPEKVEIEKPRDILDAVEKFDLELVKKAGPNKRNWGGNACLAASTCLFQTLLNASGYKAWELLKPDLKLFYFPNIAFNMVCGGEHVPGTKQDIQEMFFFTMKDKSIKKVFKTGVKFFKQFERNLAIEGKPTGTAKERGFSFPVADNFEGLRRIGECAGQLKLKKDEWAMGTDNAFSELQKTDDLRDKNQYDFRFSKQGIKSREELIDFNGSVVERFLPNFITMEDPGSENDVDAHKLMTGKYGDIIQVVVDDAAVTQMRFIIPFLASPDREKRAGNSILIKLNQAGTFTETRLATEIVLGLADVDRVETFLAARKDLRFVLDELKKLGINSLEHALANIKKEKFTAFFSHRSTEGSSEFLPYMPLLYGGVSDKTWFKAGAPNGERNLQNYNPLIRAEEEMAARGIQTAVTGWSGLPDEVIAGRREKEIK
jgi:enolase